MRIAPVVMAATAALVIVATSAADAATRKRPAGQDVYNAPPTVFTSRDESGRTRTKILVQKRSYLDGGTEVMPGDLSAGNYFQLPTQHPMSALGRNDITNPLGPIPDPWYLPGKDNPWPWFSY